jgi:hypothetical protein
MKCESCQLQLLPYLYDLLEPQERAEMAEHLANCAGCQDALRVATEQQGMLAEAVKEHHADIVFAAPRFETAVKPASSVHTAPTLVVPIAESTESSRPKRRSLFLLNRWSLAASILMVMFAIGSVISWSVWNSHASAFDSAQQRFAEAQRELAKTQEMLNKKKNENQKEIHAIQQQIDSLFLDWKNAETKTRKLLEEKRVSLTITGPQRAIAGGKNNYQVDVNNSVQMGLLNKDQKNLPGIAPQQLQVRAVNQKTQEVYFEQRIPLQQGRFQNQNTGNFELPPNLPIKPGEDVYLEFQAQTDDGKFVNLRDNLNLVFPEYVTHLTTDRPMYRPGETVRFRSLTLERFSLKPAQQKFHLRYRILGPLNQEIYKSEVASQVVGPNKEPLMGPSGQNLLGLGVGEFALPAQLPGGQYTLAVSEVNDRFNEEKRSFLVHQWQAPRYSKDVQFHRSSYGPGEQVKMTVRVTPIQGPPQNLRGNLSITADVTIDNQAVVHHLNNADAEGRSDFEFNLPQQILKGDGRVMITCNDGATTETIYRTLPIAVRDLQVDCYPEGGDLIVGVPNRVYFQARTLANRPAELEGRIVDDRGVEVARIQTVSDANEPGINQGLGSFTFTPQPKRRYTLRIDSPIGIARTVALPMAKDRGVVLHIPQGVVDGEIKLNIHNVKDQRELLIGAYCRGRLIGHQNVAIEANKQAEVTLKPVANTAGVYRITVFEKQRRAGGVYFKPLAERLIYRKGTERVDVAVESDRASYQPADSVQLNLHARNEKKEYVPAVALVAVVDNSVLKLVDDKKRRAMPTHFLLTTEIRNPDDLESADVFLGDHPKAAQSLDLLLGCQGWRRFAEQDPDLFNRRQQPPQARQPVFLANTLQVPQFLDSEQKQIEQLDHKFVTQAVEMQKKLAERENEIDGAHGVLAELQAKQVTVEQTRHQIVMNEQNLRHARAFLWQFALGGVLLTLFFVAFYLMSVGLRRMSDGENPVAWFASGLGLFAFLFMASVIGTFALMGENVFDMNNMGFGRMGANMIAPPAPFNQGFVNAMPPQAVPIPNLPDQDPNADEPFDDVDMLKGAGGMAGQPPANQLVLNNQLAQQFGQNNLDFIEPAINIDGRGPQDDRMLRRQGQYQAILLKHLGRRVQLPPVNDPSIVRQYAHIRAVKRDDVRRDFTETLYWHPVLVMPDGKAQVKFDLSDSVTSYQVLVLSHTADGRLGASQANIAAKLPFSIEPKVPSEVTNTDELVIPVAVNNDLAKPASVTLSPRVKGLEILDKQLERGLNLDPNQRKRVSYSFRPSITHGTAAVRMIGKTTGYGDAVERSFKVVQDGFPITGSYSGVLENNIEHEITLPEQWLPGSLQLQANFYPSPLAELQSGLDSMLREPNGCFEQSSSANYPNVMILNLMKQTQQANPLAEKQARQLLESGYQKLISFECVDPAKPGVKRGYEWFGQTAPPHEALTAYGLMQFRDMANVYRVEPEMLQRTEQYLLDQRDGKGGFKRNPRGLDQFGRAPDPVTNAYIVWALTESGVKENLDTELSALREQVKTSKDTYLLSLAALSHVNRNKSDDALAMLKSLQVRQKPTGEIPGAQVSITGSQGRDLLIETTSLAVLGWLKANRPIEFQHNIQVGVQWLSQQRQTGGFGSTQATILALKTMVAYHQKHPRALQAGNVTMLVRGTQPRAMQPQMINQFGQPAGGGGAPGMMGEFAMPDSNRASFSARSQDTVTLNLRDAAELVPGKNTVQLSVNGANQIPYSLTWSYRTIQPANEPNAPVKLSAKLSKQEAKEGESIQLNALIENVSGKSQGMTVAILGLPAGLALPDGFEQLKTLAALQENGTKPGAISAWELRGRELVLYWRGLPPDAKISLDLDLVCRLPGNYRGPASRAYLYYDADKKFWIEPLGVRIFESE